VAIPEGDSCEDLIHLELKQEITADLSKMWDDVTPSTDCLDLGASGPDAFLALAVKKGQDLYLVAEALSDGVDPALWRISGCDGTCEVGRDDPGPIEVLHLPVSEDGEMIVVLDMAEGSPVGEIKIRLDDVAPARLVSDGSGSSSAASEAEGRGGGDSTTILVILALLAAFAGTMRREEEPGC